MRTGRDRFSDSMEFSDKDLQKLVVPVVIEQVLAVLMGLADTVMVSSCGGAVVSGISLVDQISVLLVGLFSALAAGGSIVSAQYVGHGERKLVSKSASQLYLSMGFISSLFAVFAIVFNNQILNIIYRNLEPDVFSSASVYFFFIALSFPFLGLYNAGTALFRAFGNTKISMNISLIANILNIIGNAMLIYVFKMGAAGAAISTLFSRIISFVLILFYLFRSADLDFKITLIPDFSILKKILFIGIPTGIENSIFQVGKLIVSSFIAGLGTVVITANAITGTIANIQNIPANSIGIVLVTVVGQLIGASDEKGALKYTKKLIKMAYIYIAVIGIFIFIFADKICLLFSLDAATTDLVIIVLRYNCIATMLVHPLSFALANSIRAAGDVRYTMAVSISSMWIFRIGLAYFLGIYMGYGLLGIWAAMTIDWLVRAVFYVTRIATGKWLSHRNAIIDSN